MSNGNKFIVSYSYWILLALFYLLAASQAIQSFSYKWTTVAVHEQYSLHKTLEGESPKPYIFRIFMPYLVNYIVDEVPSEYLEKLRQRSINALQANIGNELSLMSNKTVSSYGVVLELDYIFLVASLFALRAIGRHMCITDNKVGVFIADMSPILFTLMLSLSYRVYNGFIYDHLEILCLVLYTLFSWLRKSMLSMVILAVSILNKETAILIPLLGAAISLATGDMKLNRSLLTKFVLEFAIVLCGFILIRYIFLNAPGGSVEVHAKGNFDFWFSIAPWISVTTPHLQLIPLPKPSNVLIIFPVLFAMFYRWSRKPSYIKAPLVLSCIINVPLFLLFSYRDEFRNLSLMFPFIYLASVHSIIAFYSQYATTEGASR